MKGCHNLLSPVIVESDWGAMFQDPVLNHSVSYGKDFLTADCSTLHPFGEVVLHDNDIIVAVLSCFEWNHQIFGDSLIESPVGGLL